MKVDAVPDQLTRETAEEWASWFRALGDPTRILILRVLTTASGPLTVGEITDRLDVGQSTVSHHLAKLADVGFALVDHVATSSRWRVNAACLDCFPTAAEVIMGQIPTAFIDVVSCNRPADERTRHRSHR